MFQFLLFILVVVGFSFAVHARNRATLLEEQVRLLQQQVAIMQRTLGELIRRTPQPEAAPQPTQTPAPAPASPPPSAHQPMPQPALRATGAAATGPTFIPSPQQQRSRTQREIEELIGERLLNRIGAVALIIGVGFFLKYAFDRNWISPSLRVLMGAVLGLALVALASAQREKLPIFAQGILGAGLSILYLSAYASFGFYQLVPKTVAFAMMSAVTLLTLERGRRFDSLAVALLGWAGGILTPGLLSGGAETAPEGLFIYLTLLNVALVGLATIRRPWWALEPLALLGTYLNYSGWYQGADLPPLGSTAAFLTVVWLMFHLLDWYQETKWAQENETQRGVTAALNALAYFSAMGILLEATGSNAIPYVALGLAVAYILPGVALRRSIPRHSIKAVVFLLTATGLAFEDFTTVELWALESLMILAIGLKLRVPHLHLYSLGAFGFTVASLFVTPDSLTRFPGIASEAFMLNPRGLAFIAVAVCCGAGALLHRMVSDEEMTEEAQYGKPLLHYAWTTIVFTLLTVEVLDYFDRRAGTASFNDQRAWETGLLLAALWIGYGLALVFMGRRTGAEALAHVGLAAMVLSLVTTAIFAVTFLPIEDFRLVANTRFAVVALSMAAAFAATRLLEDEGWERHVRIGLFIGMALLSFELLTAETRDHFSRRIAISQEDRVPTEGIVLSLRNKQQLAISGVWLAYSTVMMTIGIARRSRGFRISAISLLALTILKVFLYDLSFLSELYRIFSFIGLGVILLAASFAYQRYKDLIFGEG